jgi:hypothetical protein|eukprot:CAMPEP_0198289844 /NCGR_PEP_ID=MMETSP1449-20131203/7904_1 /TAXON_ID=420275 /ORGANISM="Attheya septentrionalis, Strain CCMP2084" /LENGTH=148 /DNA_ID=CAMNT_0043988247 /DNA_START=689 /DNA_END=1135 /DNA_ORIENTATION=+
MDDSNYSKLPPNEIVYSAEELQLEVLPSEASTLMKSEMMHREDDECYEENTQEIIRSQRRGAGIMCGVLGCFVGGPIVAVVAGVCAAHATQRGGAAGDIARACGDVALSTRDQAKQINEKHDCWNKATSASKELCSRTKDASKKIFNK